MQNKKISYEEIVDRIRTKINEEYGGAKEFLKHEKYEEVKEEISISDNSFISYLSNVSEGKEGVKSEKLMLVLYNVLFESNIVKVEQKIINTWYEEVD